MFEIVFNLQILLKCYSCLSRFLSRGSCHSWRVLFVPMSSSAQSSSLQQSSSCLGILTPWQRWWLRLLEGQLQAQEILTSVTYSSLSLFLSLSLDRDLFLRLSLDSSRSRRRLVSLILSLDLLREPRRLRAGERDLLLLLGIVTFQNLQKDEEVCAEGGQWNPEQRWQCAASERPCVCRSMFDSYVSVKSLWC